MDKSSLKQGMIVTVRCGKSYFVLNMPSTKTPDGPSEMVLMGNSGFLYLDDYCEDLTCADRHYPQYDIMSVYDISGQYGYGLSTIDYLNLFQSCLIWERNVK